MRSSLAIALGVLLGCAGAALLGWRPASAAINQTNCRQLSAMTDDGGQPQIGQVESDARPTPAWEAGPTFTRGDGGGL